MQDLIASRDAVLATVGQCEPNTCATHLLNLFSCLPNTVVASSDMVTLHQELDLMNVCCLLRWLAPQFGGAVGMLRYRTQSDGIFSFDH